MRLNEALKVAIPVADGLAKAHAAGIIHRDLKPSNIMVAADGRVKILDFGLAKLTEAASGSEESTLLARAETEAGTVMGTLAYMSPEQAEAKKVDTRSDIFSYGAMLYEMLSGRKAFEADSRASIIASILREDPKPLEGQPAGIDKILRRCLRKDPDRRFQSMADVKLELEEVKEDSESGKLQTPAAAARAGSRMPVLALAGVTLLAAGAGLVWFLNRPQPAPELRVRQLTADSGLTTDPTLSMDGKLVAYASDRAGDRGLDIWTHPLLPNARPLRLTSDPGDEVEPAISPDNSLVAFSRRGSLFLVPSFGGEERLLVRGARHPQFSPDGKWVAYCEGYSDLARSRVFVIPTTGGTPTAVGADIPQALVPLWSPDGKELLIWGEDGVGDRGSYDFWIAQLSGGASRKTGIAPFLAKHGLVTYLGDVRSWFGERLLIAQGNGIWELELRGNTWQPSALRKLTSATNRVISVSGRREAFVFSPQSSAYHLWKLPLNLNTGKAKGPIRSLPHSGGSQLYPTLSADASVMGYTQLSPGRSEVRVRDGNGRESAVLSESARAKISPDGSKLAYSYARSSPGIHLMDVAGGQAQRIVDPQKFGSVYGWSADGRFLVFYRTAPTRFFTFDPDKAREQELISHPKLDIHGAELSPDLKWVAFHIPAASNHPLKIAPVRDLRAAPESEWITIAAYPGMNSRPWWSPDGNLLYFISLKDGYPDIWAQPLDPATKRLRGEPFAVQEFHDTVAAPYSAGLAGFGPAIGKDEIIFSLLHRSGNIWLAEQAK